MRSGRQLEVSARIEREIEYAGEDVAALGLYSGGRHIVMKGSTVVTGVIGEDPHIVGNKLLVRALRDAGYKVVSLGIRVSQEEFVAAAIETSADAILISSLSGHGEILCRGLREKCVEAGIGEVLLYVGGNVVVGSADLHYVETTFRAMGIDRVYPAGISLEGPLHDLAGDLAKKGGAGDDREIAVS